MKKILILLLSVFCLTSCSKKELILTIKNPGDYDRLNELVEIDMKIIYDKLPSKDGLSYIVKNADGKTITSQITSDGKLLFQPHLKAQESAMFSICQSSPESYESKTYGRFIKERKEDFAWENDRVAFRIYGQALVETDGPSNGLDIWYKRTDKLIIDKWYKDDLEGKASYHEDHGEGLDDYKVGRSLGAGAMAPFVNDKLWLNENFVSEEITDNGPLRTAFTLTYKDINIEGKQYREKRTFSIDAGSQFTKVIQDYGVIDTIEVAAGIIKREKGDSAIIGKDYVIYAEPGSEKVSGIYIGLLFPEGMKRSVIDSYEVNAEKNGGKYQHVLGIAEFKPNSPLTYYTGYGWEKFGFASVADFENHTQNFLKSIKQPFVITYNK